MNVVAVPCPACEESMDVDFKMVEQHDPPATDYCIDEPADAEWCPCSDSKVVNRDAYFAAVRGACLDQLRQEAV